MSVTDYLSDSGYEKLFVMKTVFLMARLLVTWSPKKSGSNSVLDLTSECQFASRWAPALMIEWSLDLGCPFGIYSVLLKTIESVLHSDLVNAIQFETSFV